MIIAWSGNLEKKGKSLVNTLCGVITGKWIMY